MIETDMKQSAKPIFISLIPNFSIEDIKLSLKLFFQPWKYQTQAWERELQDKLSTYLDSPHVFLYDSGRSAEYFLLKALGIGSGDEVIIQAFTCVAVPNSIIWAGARPVYADIDGTLNLDPSGLEGHITPHTKAVIVQHTFGTSANLERIEAICKKHKILLLEDCAHALGGTYQGKKLGTIGDAAFFSFGRDKAISGIWGGAIMTKDSALADRLARDLEILPRHGGLWTAKQLIYAPLMWVVVHTYTFFGVGKFLHFFLRTIGLFSAALTHAEKQGRKPRALYAGIAPPLAKLISLQLDRLEAFVHHRRFLAKYYAQHLKAPYDPSSTYLRYSVFSPEASKILGIATQSDIFLGDWYTTVVGPDTANLEKAGYILGSCPRAEEVSTKVINLPTHPNVSLEDAVHIVELFNEHQWKLER